MKVYSPVFHKTLAIFSIMMKRDLKLSLDGAGVYSVGNRIVVGKESPLAENDVDLYGLLEKQIARLLFSSPNCSRALVAKFNKLPLEVGKKIYETIEDYRTETCWVEIYQGSRDIFDRISKRLIREEEIKCPLTVLLAVRAGVQVCGEWEELAGFYREQLLKVRGSSQQEAEKVVEGILSRVEEYYPSAQGETKKNEEGDRPEEAVQQDNRDESATLESAYNRITDQECDLRMEKEEPKPPRELLADYPDPEDNCEGVYWEEVEPEIDLKDLGENSTGHVILKDIFETKELSHPDINMAYELRRFLSKITEKYREINTEEGTEIDIERFIARMTDNNIRDVFLDDESINGLSITALLDLSATMDRDRRIFLARETLLTIHESLRGIAGIDFEVFGYSGSKSNAYVTPVVRLEKERLENVYPSYKFCYTHTNRAIDYIVEMLARRPFSKKIVILITDGYPEAMHGDEYYELKSLTREAITNANKKGVEIFAFIVIPDGHLSISEIFGNEKMWLKLTDFEGLPKSLSRFVIDKVYRQVVRR